MNNQTKVLIVARGAWDDSKGTSSTLTNLFGGYDPNKLAMIYVESKLPHTKCCTTFFQIPEIAMLKKLFHWKYKVGKRINTACDSSEDEQEVIAEEKALTYVRGHRHAIFRWLRELLWLLGTWKTQELKDFIRDFQPDILWFDGSTNTFLDRLYLYVQNIAKKPSVVYLMDDNYTYKSMVGHDYLYQIMHRCSMHKLVSRGKEIVYINPKMKREFDEVFHVNGTIITKGIDYSSKFFEYYEVQRPVKLLYMGQIIYGRYKTLAMVIKALTQINKDEAKIELDIYTNNLIPVELKELIDHNECVRLNDAVPYDMVPFIIKESDVLLFMESLDSKYSRDARLSFSTKITDYLASGKCILAVGPKDCAPMEYFEENNCALTSYTHNDVLIALESICDKSIIDKYALKAFETGKKNHDEIMMRKRLSDVLIRASL